MTYHAELTFHKMREDESTYEETFDTLQGAVDFLNLHGHGQCIAFINNKKITMKNGTAMGDDGEPLCTNEKWHEIFARRHEKIEPLAVSTVTDQVKRFFAPQSTRPTNVATLIGKGDL